MLREDQDGTKIKKLGRISQLQPTWGTVSMLCEFPWLRMPLVLTKCRLLTFRRAVSAEKYGKKPKCSELRKNEMQSKGNN